jgi:hypothetical protein
MYGLLLDVYKKEKLGVAQMQNHLMEANLF